MLSIARLDSTSGDFEQTFARLIAVDEASGQAVVDRVADIVSAVRQRGDAALLEYTRELDHRPAQTMADLTVESSRLQQALADIPDAQRQALDYAADRLRSYALHQQLQPWSYQDDHGNTLGQLVRPLARVGVYAPGGKAAYPSTVLMNAIPAQVAGVGEVVLVSPVPGDGQPNPLLLAAAALAGIDRLLMIGGAQAVAALAYGTESIPCVDKIVGPGNAYVAAAKRQVFGQVGIESVAGPSEVLVIADGSSDPQWAALDLFAQAEHDEAARPVLMSPDADFLEAVRAAMDALLDSQPRAAIIRASLQANGALIRTRDLDEAVELANRMAPEHLELAVADPDALVADIHHAGAVFMGATTPEALGDYCAGPNHVLPTGRSARFASPLGVYDFQKRMSLIQVSQAGADNMAPAAAQLARGEGLEAHAQSAEIRRRT